MSSYTLELNDLKRSISFGNVGQVIEELIQFTEGSTSSMTTEIYLVSARYRSLESEKLRGGLDLKDYKLEFNSITLNLLEIIDAIQHASVGTFQQYCPKEKVREELEHLSKEFEETDSMRSVPAMVRMKIYIARKMAEKIVPWPDLIKEYKGTTNQAMICAIGRKVKIVADTEDIEILASVAKNANNHISKGFLVNALMELIYAGQLQLGDEIVVYELLDILEKNGNTPLVKNVERVRAGLDFLMGKISE